MRALPKIIWLIVLLLLTFAVALLPLPRSINITQTGVLWRCGTLEEVQNTSVTVTGTYWDYLVLEDRFEGSVQVEALPETQGVISIVLLGDGQLGLWYADEDELMKYFGGLFSRKDGSVMLLIHEDGGWAADNGRILTAPASTREEAVALTNELAKECSPNWLGTYTFK